MLYGEKSREQLNSYAETLFKRMTKRSDCRSVYDSVYKKFNLPINVAEEMISFKKDVSEFTTFEVFCVVYCIDPKCLKKYFTDSEIEYLSNEKFVEEKIDFPIVLKDMVQISSDQWIGKTSVKELMKFKKARLINYEEGEQRAFRKMKSGDIEIYKPFISKKNVKEIKNAMENGTYIPDPITLNMPDGSEFYFDNNILTITSLPKNMFNLDDGYHRYIAMSQIYDFDPQFDYPMELRVVNFSNSKANSFIFQQDQKTPMKKVVSDSYNTNSIPNKIIQRINNDPGCNIQGMIGRNDAKINDAVLGKLISYFFVDRKVKKEEEMAHVIKIKNKLVGDFNLITEQNELFLGKYSEELLFITICTFASDIPREKYCNTIINIFNNLSKEESSLLRVQSSGMIRKKGVNVIMNKIKEVG